MARRSRRKPDPLVAFGDRVRARRADLGLSQEALAERANLHRTYIGGIERGERNPTLAMVHRLAGALGISPSQLLEDPPESTSQGDE